MSPINLSTVYKTGGIREDKSNDSLFRFLRVCPSLLTLEEWAGVEPTTPFGATLFKSATYASISHSVLSGSFYADYPMNSRAKNSL